MGNLSYYPRTMAQEAADGGGGGVDALHQTGNETKTSGVLTFVAPPIVPTPTAGTQQAANAAYVDALIAAGVPLVSATVPRAGGRIATLTPTDAGAPFTWEASATLFNSTYDYVSYLGYNVARGGTRANTAHPSFGLVIEADYEESPGFHWLEAYFEYHHSGAPGTPTYRPIFFGINRANGDLLRSYYSAGITSGFDVSRTDGTAIANFQPGVHNFWSTGNELLNLKAAAGFTPFLYFYGGAGGASLGNINIDTNGDMHLEPNGTVQSTKQLAAAGGILVQRAASPGIIVRRASSGATPALQTWEDEGSNALIFINAAGYLNIYKTTAPADATLFAGGMALWFDSTNGAAKLMIKAKQANGAVVTGSVALA